MPCVPINDLLLSAQRDRYAVPAINAANYETLCAVIDAAEAERAPVIIQVYRRLVDDGHVARLAPMILHMARRASVPVAVHLDHGETLSQVRQCIDCRFTSIMIDGSLLPFAENVRLVQEAARTAHAAGVSVEAELGHVPSADHEIACDELTDPAQAADFVKRTRVDVLAIAIGTAHGRYRRTPVLDFDRLERIRAAVDVPLVLHGGSGTPEDSLRRCIALGITKINIATEFQSLFLEEARNRLEEQDGRFLPIDIMMKPVVAKLVEYVRAIMARFGASGRGNGRCRRPAGDKS